MRWSRERSEAAACIVIAPEATAGALGALRLHSDGTRHRGGHDGMAKHSKRERERRVAESERARQVEAAWMGTVPPAPAKAFTQAVEAARARGPQEPQPDMAPGTPPRPPRPGHEPKPPKEERGRRPSRD